ncbi:MAG: T9SS type A sorting domain-containing protein, partial [Bacteroidota bacterium]
IFNYSVIGTSSLGCSANASVSVKINACVGIDSYVLNNGLRLYPNPNAGEFTVEVPQVPTQLFVYNLLGEEIIRAELNAQNNFKTKISSLSKGIYVLTCIAEQSQVSRKIIVE